MNNQSTVSTPCCANCGGERITYKGSEDKQLVLLFAFPASKDLTDENIKQACQQFAMAAANALWEERKRRGVKGRKIHLSTDL